MTRIWRVRLCVCLWMGLSVSQAACVKTARWFEDGVYSYRGVDGQPTGLYVELLRDAMRRMDCTVQWMELPWARGLAELEGGQLDILPGARKTVERERFAYFSRPVNRSPNVLFMSVAANQRYKFNKLADMMGTEFRLGIQIGVAYGPEYDELIKNPDFIARTQPLTVRRNAWGLLQMGRLDGLIADEVTAWGELESLGLSKAVVRTKVVTSDEPGQYALSKRTNTPEFVAGLDKALNAMLADGSYKRIRERFVPCTTSVETQGCR